MPTPADTRRAAWILLAVVAIGLLGLWSRGRSEEGSGLPPVTKEVVETRPLTPPDSAHVVCSDAWGCFLMDSVEMEP